MLPRSLAEPALGGAAQTAGVVVAQAECGGVQRETLLQQFAERVLAGGVDEGSPGLTFLLQLPLQGARSCRGRRRDR